VDDRLTAGEALEHFKRIIEPRTNDDLLLREQFPHMESVELFDYYKGRISPRTRRASASELSTGVKTGP
jgi:hypothetical protein